MSRKRKSKTSARSGRNPKSAASKPRSARATLSVATSARHDVRDRMAAFAEAPLAVCASDANLQATLKVLRDQNEPVRIRLAALQALQAASFSVVAFADCRADYISTLREVANDPDPALRQRALGILAREKDGFAQKKLLAGLRDSEKALVPPEKALQLLGYDVHGDAYSVARAIVEKPPNPSAKREALRLLAADSKAGPMFEKLLRDKDETREVRQISAAALQAINPNKLRTHARAMLLDPSEYDDIQATSLSALTQFGDAKSLEQDKPLLKRVERLSGRAKSAVKQTARQFLGKYRR